MICKYMLLIIFFVEFVVVLSARSSPVVVLQQQRRIGTDLERFREELIPRPASPLLLPPPPPVLSTSKATVRPVSVVVHYETMCPGSRAFITQQLLPLHKKVGSTVINVTFVPYGNTKELSADGRNEYECRHGSQQCFGNKIHACLLNSGSTNTDVIMSFIGCTEKNATKYPSEAVRECCQSVGVDCAQLERCAYYHDQYSQIMHEYAVLTARLRPKQQGVPYVQIDGKFEPGATDNLVMFVCSAYKGLKPAVCASNIAAERATLGTAVGDDITTTEMNAVQEKEEEAEEDEEEEKQQHQASEKTGNIKLDEPEVPADTQEQLGPKVGDLFCGTRDVVVAPGVFVGP